MIYTILFNGAFFALIYLWQRYRLKVAEKEIINWAKEQSCKLLAYKFKLIDKGPFFWNSVAQDLVFKVALENKENIVEECWIRIGDSKIGMLFNKTINVKWCPQHTEL